MEDNPYTGIEQTKNFQINLKINMLEQALVFDDPTLLEIYNKHKDASKAEIKTIFKAYRLHKKVNLLMKNQHLSSL